MISKPAGPGLLEYCTRNLLPLGGLVGQIVVAVWFLATADARITRNAQDISVMQARNIPSRMQTVEDNGITMQRDISALQGEYRDITNGLNDQNQRLATIGAKLDILLNQFFPSNTGRTAPHLP